MRIGTIGRCSSSLIILKHLFQYVIIMYARILNSLHKFNSNYTLTNRLNILKTQVHTHEDACLRFVCNIHECTRLKLAEKYSLMQSLHRKYWPCHINVLVAASVSQVMLPYKPWVCRHMMTMYNCLWNRFCVVSTHTFSNFITIFCC